MIKIGLTGGIATGKSTVVNFLKQKKIAIIDCDILAKQAVALNKPAYYQVVAYFGTDILQQNKEINRGKLGSIVFNDKQKRKALEQIIHKQVLRDVNELLLTYNSEQIVVIDIPLLFEAKLEYLVDEIWVVYCAFDQQLTRLMQRNNYSKAEAKARINAQMPIDFKKQHADIVLDNSSTISKLLLQVEIRLNELTKNGEKS